MERDDIIEYSLHAHHSEEEGKKIRKKIWMVFFILLAVTAVEVAMGAFLTADDIPIALLRFIFIFLTVGKAAYIVMIFMHLGDERKGLKWVILAPYTVFIMYLLYICIVEAEYIHYMIKYFLG